MIAFRKIIPWTGLGSLASRREGNLAVPWNVERDTQSTSAVVRGTQPQTPGVSTSLSGWHYEDSRWWGAYTLLVGMQTGTATMGNRMEVPQEIKHRTAIWLSNSTSGYLYKGDETIIAKHICTPVLTAALATTAKMWRQPQCPWTSEWIKKMWSIHKMHYYSAFKKEGSPIIHSNTNEPWVSWMNLMFHEISFTELFHLFLLLLFLAPPCLIFSSSFQL